MKKYSNREAYEKRKGREESLDIGNQHRVTKPDSTLGVNKDEENIKGKSADKNLDISPKTVPSPESQPQPKPKSQPKTEKKPISQVKPKAKPQPQGKNLEEKAKIKEIKPREQSSSTPKAKAVKAQTKKNNQGKAILICGAVVVIGILLFVALYSAFGAKEDFHAAFTMNSNVAKIGSKAITMDNKVYIKKDTGMLPLNDAAKILPITVKWDGESNDVTVKGNGVKVKFTIGTSVANVNGEDETWPEAPLVKHGEVFVPLVVFCKDMQYNTAYSASLDRVDVFPFDENNKPPTVSFTTDKDTYEVDERVKYKVDAKDPDGDEIVDYKWTNYQEAYDEPDEVTITLRVMDSRGAWSSKVKQTINIE
ncbi:MAG: stalk domain-containing protein [Clostridiales bacterium]